MLNFTILLILSVDYIRKYDFVLNRKKKFVKILVYIYIPV